jgi:hypothetical protein
MNISNSPFSVPSAILRLRGDVRSLFIKEIISYLREEGGGRGQRLIDGGVLGEGLHSEGGSAATG